MRLIDANKLRLDVCEFQFNYDSPTDSMIGLINEQPTIQQERTAIMKDHHDLFELAVCSHCDMMIDDWCHYCPHCGAEFTTCEALV